MYFDQLLETYNSLRVMNVDWQIEDYEVVKTVHQFRLDWKPAKVSTLLLAESHVFTNKQSFEKLFWDPVTNEHRNYVNFFYCLAYGERRIVNSEYGGSPQFWKLFNVLDGNNYSVLKKDNKQYEHRINHKKLLLQSLKEKGVWLLDASIIGIYANRDKPEKNSYKAILKTSFSGFCIKIIEDLQPQNIVIIGKSVYDVVSNDISTNHPGISTKWIYQPNYRGHGSKKQDKINDVLPIFTRPIEKE